MLADLALDGFDFGEAHKVVELSDLLPHLDFDEAACRAAAAG